MTSRLTIQTLLQRVLLTMFIAMASKAQWTQHVNYRQCISLYVGIVLGLYYHTSIFGMFQAHATIGL